MKRALFSAACVLLVTASCHKRCEDHKPTVSPNIWSYGDQTHIARISTWTKPSSFAQLHFYADDAAVDGPGISFRFAITPRAGGTYKVVANPVNDYELSIFARSPLSAGYYSTGNDGATVRIRIEDGRLHLYAEHVILRQDPLSGSDSTGFSFNLSEL